ncbi:MAG: KamA family radical SAM protein [Lachnospiraceae bacterium]|nr:KamA family radical SAM protein [Lachnospiraceae bacterium]
MTKWKELLQNSIRDAASLKKVLDLTEEEVKSIQAIADDYPMCVNPYYLSLIDPKDPDDAIRRMSIPDAIEFTSGGSADTSGESGNTVIRGMQHKYRQTALILSTNQCAMYCRHCFRKRMAGKAGQDETAVDINAMAEYVAAHPEINNVLISGGDAFLNSNETIRRYLDVFSEVPSLQYIRFGTRTPVVLPQRITEDGELAGILREYGRKIQLVIVTQFNHPKELTDEAKCAVNILHENGCVIRNQTVLLKGVNDDEHTLADLMNGLVAAGVIPYYLFQCRPAAGVKNQFQVPLIRAVDIVDSAKMHMSGQAKGFRYVMSHPTGKIEILGKTGHGILFKYHQAKHDDNHARYVVKNLGPDDCWLDESEITSSV